MKHPREPDTAEPVAGTVVPPTEVCPYCHKSLDDENGGYRLAHEHGNRHTPRERHPTYAELFDALRAIRNFVAERARVSMFPAAWNSLLRMTEVLGERGEE